MARAGDAPARERETAQEFVSKYSPNPVVT